MKTIAYDCTLMQPACVLIQAAMGAAVSAAVFPSETWLLYPTPELKLYEVTEEQLEILIKRSKK